MYLTTFANTSELNEKPLFELLQDALTSQLKALTFSDAETVMAIKQKINAVSDERGSYCPMCGTIKTMPTGVQNFFRPLKAGVVLTEIQWHPAEIEKIREVIKACPKDYLKIEDWIALGKKFNDAQPVQEAAKAT